jgi:hypothetical protein
MLYQLLWTLHFRLAIALLIRVKLCDAKVAAIPLAEPLEARLICQATGLMEGKDKMSAPVFRGFQQVKQKRIGYLLLVLSLAGAITIKPLSAQPIVPAVDDTNTVVTPNSNRLDITGGILSRDGANLFHSFTNFGLDANQIANFLSKGQG